MTQERIVAAAARIRGLVGPDGTILDDVILSMAPPARHCHLIWAAHAMGYKGKLSAEDQAFLTSKGEFVDRREAARIALAAGQIERLHWPPDLYSEDLW